VRARGIVLVLWMTKDMGKTTTVYSAKRNLTPWRTMMQKTRVLVIPDTHAPNHDSACIKAVLKFAKAWKPDVCIHLGDVGDFNSLSRYQVASARELIGLDNEVKACNEMLDMIEYALPKKCKKVVTLGNHDQRPEMYSLNNWDAQCRKVLGRKNLGTAQELYHLEERGWRWFDYGQVFRMGKAMFSHGWYYNQDHAAKTLRKWFKNIYYGHTHQYQTHTVNGMDGYPVQAMSLGTLSRFDLSYLKGAPPDWCHMFCYFDFWGPNFTPHPTTIIDGGFMAEGELWQG